MQKLAILFKGSTCAPCQMFEPIFDKVVSEYPALQVRKETDNVELMSKFGVRQVPVIVLVDVENGRMEANHIMAGKALRKESIHEAVMNFLADDGSE